MTTEPDFSDYAQVSRAEVIVKIFNNQSNSGTDALERISDWSELMPSSTLYKGPSTPIKSQIRSGKVTEEEELALPITVIHKQAVTPTIQGRQGEIDF